MNIGLTGGIATGKSTVAKMFQKRGAALIDADQIARDVVKPGTEGAKRIREAFGKDMFWPNGELNRKKLGAYIFAHDHARKKLNDLLHPLIREEMQRRAEIWQDHIVIWDIPLLYENRLTHLVEKVIVVYIPEPLQLKRLIKRDQLTEEDAKLRLKAQISIEKKRKWADFVIDNSGPLDNTERQVEYVWNYLNGKNGFNQL